jgi:hypothetical protein
MNMKTLGTLSTCLLALTLHNSAWAEIYEVKDAEGNTEFTDAPPADNAKEIDLQQTNIADAPPSGPQSAPQSEEGAAEAAATSSHGNQPAIVNGGNENEAYEEYVRKERQFEEMDPSAPDQVGDSPTANMPDEVGDFPEENMPQEVGDSPEVYDDGGDPVDEGRVRHRVIHHGNRHR